jgi:hypothetical protein
MSGVSKGGAGRRASGEGRAHGEARRGPSPGAGAGGDGCDGAAEEEILAILQYARTVLQDPDMDDGACHQLRMDLGLEKYAIADEQLVDAVVDA